MTTTHQEHDHDDPPVELRLLTDADEMRQVNDVFRQVWGTDHDPVPVELLMAISHAGGYVAAAFDESDRMLGASVGLLARHDGAPALHSHITGLLPGLRHSGVGRSMKWHQMGWARRHGIEWIVWTFDPLVRANAWFNIAVLGADVDAYLPSFYGPMDDGINAGDETDRLLMAWRVEATDGVEPGPLRDGAQLPDDVAITTRIPTPDDVVSLRRTDLAEVERWRTRTREAFQRCLEHGERVVGFTREGDYLFARLGDA